MDKKQYYADRINEIIHKANVEGVRIAPYTSGTGDIKDVGIIITDLTDNDEIEMIAISLIR